MITFGLDTLPSQATEVIALKAKGIEVLLIPIVFLSLQYTSLQFHSKTFGQKIFKHHVHFSQDKSAWLYSLALLVSPVLMGIPILNSWVDEFSSSQTMSIDYSYLNFLNTFEHAEETVVDLFEMIEIEEIKEHSWQKAA